MTLTDSIMNMQKHVILYLKQLWRVSILIFLYTYMFEFFHSTLFGRVIDRHSVLLLLQEHNIRKNLVEDFKKEFPDAGYSFVIGK